MPNKNTIIPFQIPSQETISFHFEQIIKTIERDLSNLFLSRQTKVDLRTAFFEAVANAIRHGNELKTHKYVKGRFFINHRHIGFEVYDHGKGYDLENVPMPDWSDLKGSGRGVFMMKQLGDEVKYRIGKNKNTLIFKRFLVGQNATTREIDLLYNISESVIRQSALDEIYGLILDQALEIFDVERASILIFDEKSRRLKVVASRGMSDKVAKNTKVRSGEGVSGYVFQHGRPLLIEDIETNKRGIEKKSGYKSSSFISAPMICSPLRINERPLGVINLTDKRGGRKFSKRDLKLLSTMANQAMACLYIRDLINDVKEKEILEQELETVRNIQSSYLPGKPPKTDQFDLSGICEMAESVGGDYFDYKLLGKDLYLVVADVSGHNISSAMTMLNFRSQLQVLWNLKYDPAKILNHLGKFMYEDLSRTGHFVSAIIVKINIDNGTYKMASAGHYPPLFFDKDFELIESGLVLGIEKNEKYKNVVGALKKGNGMVLFTDGVIEAMNKNQNFFGIERLQDMILKNREKNAEKLNKNIIKKVMSYRSEDSPLDDITILTLKYD